MTSLLFSLALLLFSVGVCWCYGLEGCSNNYKDRNDIWCSHRNIQNISRVVKRIPQNATKINFSRNRICILPPDVFRKFWRLQDLTLRRNEITSLERGQFRGLGELKHLNLSSNNLSEVEPGAFQGLTQLKDLSLNGNLLVEIPVGFFDFLPQLSSLDLSLNKLNYLDGSLCNSSTLENLDLSYNNISWLKLAGFSALISLDLSFNPLLHPMPYPLALNPSLTRLMLIGIGPELLSGLSEKSQNALHKVSFSISVQRPNITVCSLLEGMPNLKYANIDLGGSGLQKNTSVLIECHTPNLLIMRNASLGHMNKYRLVQDENWTTQLSLVQCGLQSIAETTFQGLWRVGFLNVQDNLNLDIHADTFVSLRKLKKLNLNNVGLREPNTDWFRNLLDLESLSMIKNEMTKLATNAFSPLHKLKSLSLRYNFIQVIDNQPFCNLSLLQSLDLSMNVINHIEKGSFKDLVNLNTLNLEGNHIKSVNPDIFHGLEHLISLILYNNQLHFNEGDSPFIKLKFLKNINLGYQGPITIGMGYLGRTLFRGLENLENLSLGFVTLTTFHLDTFAPLVNLKSLFINDVSMTNTNLTALFHPFASLTDLFLMKTDLDFLPYNLFPSNNTLRYLKLQCNHFHIIEKSLYDNLPSLQYLDVTDNPLSCSCENAWFKNWSLNSLEVQVPYLYDLPCNNDPMLPHLWEFDDKACSYHLIDFYFFLSTALLDILILLLGLTWHKHRSSIRYLILLLRSRISGRKKGKKVNFTYDAFISYSSLDEPWVMGELVPRLEGPKGKGFRLCLHHRDFRLGAAILENIEVAIYGSRRTLCVVSRDFLRSEWCTLEFQLASLRLLCDRSDVLLLVFLEDIPDHCLSSYTRLRRMVRKNTYLLWPDAAADREAFWIRLQNALREGVEEETESFARLLC